MMTRFYHQFVVEWGLWTSQVALNFSNISSMIMNGNFYAAFDLWGG
jgi:hypothetical protein